MTLEELFSRVVRSHLVLITTITLLPVGLVLALGMTQPPPYRASVRIQATAAVPTSSTEADGLSSRVLAIATTPGVVRRAMESAGVRGNAVDVSEKHVTAQRLGESPVVELTVTDSSRADAAALVSELSTRVLEFMNTADRGRFETAVQDVTKRLADTRAQRDRLFTRMQATPPGDARDRLKDLATEASQVAQELSSQRASLIMADVTRGRAVLVDRAGPTVLREPSGLAPRAAQALVLGRCLALAVAAPLETLRPRVPDARGLARVLDVPLLSATKRSPATLADTLSLVARRHGLDTVVLMAVDPAEQAQASTLALSLARTLPDRRRSYDTVATETGRPRGPVEDESSWSTAFVDLTSLSPSQEVSAGVAVVCGGAVSHEHVESLHDVLQATRWPVIGVLDSGRAWQANSPDVWSAGVETS